MLDLEEHAFASRRRAHSLSLARDLRVSIQCVPKAHLSGWLGHPLRVVGARAPTSLGLEEPEVPGLFGLTQASDGGLHAAQQLRRCGEHRGSNTDGDATWPVPHTGGCHAFDAVHQLEGPAQSWRKIGERLFHRCKVQRYRVPARPQATARSTFVRFFRSSRLSRLALRRCSRAQLRVCATSSRRAHPP